MKASAMCVTRRICYNSFNSLSSPNVPVTSLRLLSDQFSIRGTTCKFYPVRFSCHTHTVFSAQMRSVWRSYGYCGPHIHRIFHTTKLPASDIRRFYFTSLSSSWSSSSYVADQPQRVTVVYNRSCIRRKVKLKLTSSLTAGMKAR